jgi:hypothetical protein
MMNKQCSVLVTRCSTSPAHGGKGSRPSSQGQNSAEQVRRQRVECCDVFMRCIGGIIVWAVPSGLPRGLVSSFDHHKIRNASTAMVYVLREQPAPAKW